MALYRAKADGRGTYRFFEPEMDALHAGAARAWSSICARRLANGEFELYYQPLVNLETERDHAASKRCCAGTIPNADWFRRSISFRSRKKPA